MVIIYNQLTVIIHLYIYIERKSNEILVGIKIDKKK